MVKIILFCNVTMLSNYVRQIVLVVLFVMFKAALS